jgi:DNA-binding Lrp family transcriptional regulator
MAISLDDLDVRLLDALQRDADRTNVELARIVGLSPTATMHRLRRLKSSGVVAGIAVCSSSSRSPATRRPPRGA